MQTESGSMHDGDNSRYITAAGPLDYRQYQMPDDSTGPMPASAALPHQPNHFPRLAMQHYASAPAVPTLIETSASPVKSSVAVRHMHDSMSGLSSGYPSIIVAPPDTIDSSIVAQVETNIGTEEYIWSPQDATLYELGNARAQAAIGVPGAIKLVFPPATVSWRCCGNSLVTTSADFALTQMIMAWEKDGSLASPAFRPLHPHSNQWLKAQVCNNSCAYRAGTNSLKRPITIRDHFRKVSPIVVPV